MEPQLEPLTTAPVAENNETQTKPEPLTKEQIVGQMIEIAGKNAADITREEVNRLKLLFYAIRHDEVAAQKKEFCSIEGNNPDDFQPEPDAAEEQFKNAYGTIKEKKAALAAEQEAERIENLNRKNDIIAQITAAAEETDSVHLHIDRVRELQQEFKAVGEVPATEVSDTWKRYQQATETFYDRLKVNKDLRDLDFKKNLELKTLIIDETAKLVDEPDVVVAFRRLQDLRDKWRETGPVAKEFREEIWNRFSDLVTEINKRHQAFFEERKAMERTNENAKTAIIAQLEEIKTDALTSFAAWEEATAKVITLQGEWKQLGFASRKTNAQLYERFRKLCDDFFAAKAAHFKSVKEESIENLAKKISLCEQAEELAESTDWAKTTDALIALQATWKTIGTTNKKQSDAAWARFRAACDKFFEAKKQHLDGQRTTEQANLKAKRGIIEQLKAIGVDENENREEATARVRELMKEYQAIGHVPFRDKDKIHTAYRAEVSRLYEQLDMSRQRSRMHAFETEVSELKGNELARQRQSLVRALEAKKNEIKTYENNLGFLSASTKSGNSMLQDMQRRIERLRREQETIEQKIQLIDSKTDA